MEKSNSAPQHPTGERSSNRIIIATLVLIIIILVGIIFYLLTDSDAPEPLISRITQTSSSPPVLGTPTLLQSSLTIATSPPNAATTTLPTAMPALPADLSATELPAAKVTITKEQSDKGDFLNVAGGGDNFNYKIGPLAEGVYAVGPNNKFLVYVTNDGTIFATKNGDPELYEIGRIKKIFSATSMNVEPFF